MAHSNGQQHQPSEDPRLTDGIEVELDDGPRALLVEVRPSSGRDMAASAAAFSAEAGVDLDDEFEPIVLDEGDGADRTLVVRCQPGPSASVEQLEARDDVVGVWDDTPVAPFESPVSVVDAPAEVGAPTEEIELAGRVPCPYGTCDCDSRTPKGTAADVRSLLGVDKIWASGFKGSGVVVGVVDGGITAKGRAVKPGETNKRIDNVIGGWPTQDWGTTARAWSNHGNMCATDVLLMAPEARIYDMRISGAPNIAGTISRALSAYDWAIKQHRQNGTPQVISNSWGIFQETWDKKYARDPRHPFTRKVVEAVRRGIVVLFAAGNCGGTCRSSGGRCGTDRGPGRSIWGANGHKDVMTIGAVNPKVQFVGYSSRGPAALDPLKPDFCGVTHFTGYYRSDSGTSAATPIVAGVSALLKQAQPSASTDRLKRAFAATARDLAPGGWDHHSGAGLVQAKGAFGHLRRRRSDRVRTGVQFTGRLDARKTARWYTFNWPADWQVLWNVVSLTPDPRTRQLKWDVEIERASNNRITYWIVVTNLSKKPIDIAGRFVIAGS